MASGMFELLQCFMLYVSVFLFVLVLRATGVGVPLLPEITSHEKITC